MNEKHRILLTGATGYVGGRLLRRLEIEGYHVNTLVRSPGKLTACDESTHIFQGDLLEPESLERAFQDVDIAYYMVHSMDGGAAFEQREQTAAENFVRAARHAGVRRIVYLGGLGNEQEDLSTHLKSRHNVGRILRESGIPTIELRASIVLGAGSISFEMIRSLTEHLPFMVMPKWVSVEAQPIAINDLLEYLVESMRIPIMESMVVEIGGSDRVSYRDLMVEYARQRNLNRMMLPVPFLTPWLSSHWLGLVTPLYASVGRHLIEGVRNRTVVEHPENAALFQIKPSGIRVAISEALQQERREQEDHRWMTRLDIQAGFREHHVVRHRNLLIDYRCSETAEPAGRIYAVLSSFGGSRGMFAWNGLWRFRGFVDRCLGGNARPRPANDRDVLKEGQVISSFHVERIERNRRIRLKTDMKLPGEAWLEFRIDETDSGSVFHHAIIYEPKGLLGLLYWHAIYPLHALVFRSMHNAILREAKAQDGGAINIPVLLNH